MITIKPIVFAHQRRADNSYNVKIRVTFRGKQKYLATTIIARPSDLTRTLALKPGPIKAAADSLVLRIERILAEFPANAPAANCDDVVSYIRSRLNVISFKLDFFEFADDFLKTKTTQTAGVYTSALNTFARTSGRPLDINDIRKETIQKFIDDNPDTDTGARLVLLHAVFKAARERYNDLDEGILCIPRDPFASFHCTATPGTKGAKALGLAEIQKLIDTMPRTRAQRIGVAAGLFSFVTMGANLADLYEARPPKGNVWTYQRKKTRSRRKDNAEMKVVLLPIAQTLATFLSSGTEGRWLDRISNSYNHTINTALRGVAQELGLPSFTFYSFRKAWATIARRNGVEKATIDEGLAHVGDYKVADIYIERDYTAMNEANAKVVALLDWSNCWVNRLLGKAGGDK